MGLLDIVEIENENFIEKKDMETIIDTINQEYLVILEEMKSKVSFFSYVSFIPYLKSIIESIDIYGKRKVSNKNTDPHNLEKSSKKHLIKIILDYVEDVLTINEKIYSQCFFDPFYPIRENYSKSIEFLKNFPGIPILNITPWSDECVKNIDRKLFMNWKEYISIIATPAHYVHKYDMSILENYAGIKILKDFNTNLNNDDCKNYDKVLKTFTSLTKNLSVPFSKFLEIKESLNFADKEIILEETLDIVESIDIPEQSAYYSTFVDSIKYFFSNWEYQNLASMIEVIKSFSSSLSGKLIPVDRVYIVYSSFFFSLIYQVLYNNYYITINQIIYIFYLSGLSSCFFTDYDKNKYIKYYGKKLSDEELKLINNIHDKNIKNLKKIL